MSYLLLFKQIINQNANVFVCGYYQFTACQWSIDRCRVINEQDSLIDIHIHLLIYSTHTALLSVLCISFFVQLKSNTLYQVCSAAKPFVCVCTTQKPLDKCTNARKSHTHYNADEKKLLQWCCVLVQHMVNHNAIFIVRI